MVPYGRAEGVEDGYDRFAVYILERMKGEMLAQQSLSFDPVCFALEG